MRQHAEVPSNNSNVLSKGDAHQSMSNTTELHLCHQHMRVGGCSQAQQVQMVQHWVGLMQQTGMRSKCGLVVRCPPGMRGHKQHQRQVSSLAGGAMRVRLLATNTQQGGMHAAPQATRWRPVLQPAPTAQPPVNQDIC
jgi:hypothetical protein